VIGRLPALAAAAALGVTLAACGSPTLSPFRHHMEVGVDRYLIFVADAPGGSDLFAARDNGSDLIEVTFTPVLERSPVLSPDGAVVAFLRATTPADTAPHLWLENLVNGAEREFRIPGKRPPRIEAAAWSRDGRTLYVRTSAGLWQSAAPPARMSPAPVGPAERAVADSAFEVLLGDPPVAYATACPGGVGLCAVGDSGRVSPLAPEGRDPFRWGSDSVAYFLGDAIVIRPLGGGRTRTLIWRPAVPVHPRQPTFFGGAPAR